MSAGAAGAANTGAADLGNFRLRGGTGQVLMPRSPRFRLLLVLVPFCALLRATAPDKNRVYDRHRWGLQIWAVQVCDRHRRGLQIWATCGYVVARGGYLFRILHALLFSSRPFLCSSTKFLPLVLFVSLPCVAACRRPEPGAVSQDATLCTHVVSFRDFAISFPPRTWEFVIYFGFCP